MAYRHKALVCVLILFIFLAGCSVTSPKTTRSYASGENAGGGYYYESVGVGDVFLAAFGVGLAVFLIKSLANCDGAGDKYYEDYYK
jgi:hypothetical protein